MLPRRQDGRRSDTRSDYWVDEAYYTSSATPRQGGDEGVEGRALAEFTLIRHAEDPTSSLRTPCAAAARKPPRSDLPDGKTTVNV